MPKDYLSYLLSQRDDGARFHDRIDRNIGGRPATVLTATTKRALDGSLGCFEPEQVAHDCLGLQPELQLRIAVIPSRKETILIWLREDTGAEPSNLADHLKRFDAMLDSITFGSTNTSSLPSPTQQSPVDGVWTATSTRAELEQSAPDDPEEINDGNWGTFTLDLHGGTGVESMQGNPQPYRFELSYHLDGNVLTIARNNGEQFVVRWRIENDQLILTKDTSLGLIPIPFVMKPLKLVK